MKQILWFRRDLRVSDSGILANAKDEVLPIFIFDKNILDKLSKDDKRVSFIYKTVLELKEKLKAINLDLAIFYGTPKEIFEKLKTKGFDSILCSVDFDDYAKKRDEEVSKIIPIQTFTDSFIIHPKDCLKSDKTPYKVFTPFYKSLNYIWESEALEEYEVAKNLKKIEFDYDFIPSLTDLGFENQKLPDFLNKSAEELINDFSNKILPLSLWLFPLATLSGVALSVGIGWLAVRQLLGTPPLLALRAGA